jgi:hypothetical protein
VKRRGAGCRGITAERVGRGLSVGEPEHPQRKSPA